MSTRVRPFSLFVPALMAGFVLLLSACSTSMVYQRLDVLVPWYVSKHVDLEPDQRQLLDQMLDARLQWHCSTQLPAYAQWLQTTSATLHQPPDPLALQDLTTQAQTLWTALMAALAPDVTKLLRELNRSQTTALFASLAREIDKDERTYLRPSPERQRSNRIERMKKRVSRWLGSVQPGQRAAIEAWADSLRPSTADWLETRRKWQQHLHQAVIQARSEAEAEQAITALLTAPDTLWPEHYRNAFEHNRATTLGLLVTLAESLTDEQKAHLQDELKDWEQLFARLACTAPTAPLATVQQ